jgi:putative membrane protein (TIGR04086 family)
MDNEKLMECIEILKAVTLSLACALVATSVFALIGLVVNVSQKALLPVNLTIKAVSIFLGCAVALRGSRGLLRGIIVGLAFTCLSGLLFGLVGGGLAFSWLLILEVVFGVIAGGLSGAFAVNLR